MSRLHILQHHFTWIICAELNTFPHLNIYSAKLLQHWFSTFSDLGKQSNMPSITSHFSKCIGTLSRGFPQFHFPTCFYDLLLLNTVNLILVGFTWFNSSLEFSSCSTLILQALLINSAFISNIPYLPLTQASVFVSLIICSLAWMSLQIIFSVLSPPLPKEP